MRVPWAWLWVFGSAWILATTYGSHHKYRHHHTDRMSDRDSHHENRHHHTDRKSYRDSHHENRHHHTDRKSDRDSHHENRHHHTDRISDRGDTGETEPLGMTIENYSPKLILSEEFSSGGIDFRLWNHEISAGGIRGQSWEFQYYQNNRTNSYVKDGHLYITPTLTSDQYGVRCVTGNISTTMDLWGGTPASQCTSNNAFGCSRTSNSIANITLPPIQSARLKTVGTFSFRYGRVEVEAKLPRGDWLHPSIWLLPEREEYGGWPASGEINMVQSRGNTPGYNASLGGGCDTIISSATFGSHFSNMHTESKSYTLPDGLTFADDFHIFGMVWNDKELYTYVDNDDNRVLQLNFDSPLADTFGLFDSGVDSPYAGSTSNGAPYDKNFYIVLDVGAGGLSGFFPDGEGQKPWNDDSPKAALDFITSTSEWLPTWKSPSLVVKSIKVWSDETESLASAADLQSVEAFLPSSGSMYSEPKITTTTTAHLAFWAIGLTTFVSAMVGIAVGVYLERKKRRCQSYEVIM